MSDFARVLFRSVDDIDEVGQVDDVREVGEAAQSVFRSRESESDEARTAVRRDVSFPSPEEVYGPRRLSGGNFTPFSDRNFAAGEVGQQPARMLPDRTVAPTDVSTDKRDVRDNSVAQMIGEAIRQAQASANAASSGRSTPGGTGGGGRVAVPLPTDVQPGDPGTARGVVDNITTVFNSPFVGLNALANLTNIERGREQGFGANVQGAGDVIQDFVNDPAQNEAVKWLQEIGYPYPEAGGLVADLFMPGPGETKAIGSAASKAAGSLVGVASALPVGRAFRKVPEAEAFIKQVEELSQRNDLDAVETMQEFDTRVGGTPNNPVDIDVYNVDQTYDGNTLTADIDFRTKNYKVQSRVSPDDGGLYIDTLNRRGELKDMFLEAKKQGLDAEEAAMAAGLEARSDLGYIGGILRDVADTHGLPAYGAPGAFDTQEMATSDLFRMYNKLGFVPEYALINGQRQFTGRIVRPTMPTDPKLAKQELRNRIDLFQQLDSTLPEDALSSVGQSAQEIDEMLSALPPDLLDEFARYTDEGLRQGENYFGTPRTTRADRAIRDGARSKNEVDPSGQGGNAPDVDEGGDNVIDEDAMFDSLMREF